MMKTYDTIVRAFQLTRSVGSVTAQRQNLMVAFIFQLTRSVGSVTRNKLEYDNGETNFNSHAPWGA